MSENTLDIVQLIEKNPITRFNSNDYSNKLVNKIKKEFSDTQQQLFLGSFYCYLNYNSKKDFVIDLDNVWKWCGFSRKGFAKTLLEKYFNKDIDYIILLPVQEVLLQTEKQVDMTGGGLNKEQILMTIKTFKKFCLKAKTKKADEIHDYYIKLEELIQETLEEESDELRNQLQLKEKENIEQKNIIKFQEDELNKLKKIKNKLYIGHDPIIKNLYNLGITEDLTRRLEQHKTSNPGFVYLFTYESENVILIENMIKILLKQYKKSKPEWFEIDYKRLKNVFDFVVSMYDIYKIHKSIENLDTFIMKYNRNRLTNSNKSRQHFLHKDYEKFVKENIILTNDNTKVSLKLVIQDFDKWVKDNNIHSELGIYSNTKQLSTSFVKEIKDKLDEILKINNRKMNISDKKRNIFSSKVIGWEGVELKSIKDQYQFFSKKTYCDFINEYIEITDKESDRIVCKFFITIFLNWCEKNKIKSNREDYIKNCGGYSSVFQKDFRNNIKIITGKKYFKQKSHKGVNGIFCGLKFILL